MSLIKNRIVTFGVAMVSIAVVLVIAQMTIASGPITHFVSVGGPDITGPGGDKNFSINAKERDGVTIGTYIDRFAAENTGANGDGFQADVDCLSVVGNTAWVSGVITRGSINGTDLTGFYVMTKVQDNGTSSKDPVDKISYSYISSVTAYSCLTHYNLPLLDHPQGHVTVR